MSIQRYLQLIKRISLLLVLYTFCRVLFFLFNQKSFESAEMSAILLAFVHGERFDLSIIFSSNLLFILLSILPFSFQDSKNWYRFLKILFLVVNTPLLLMNMADVEYYKFTLKRTGYDVVGIMDDVTSQFIQLSLHYWYIPLIVVLFVLLLLKFYGTYRIEKTKKIKSLYAWLIIPFVVLFCILIIRGGFQYKPLKPDHAFVLMPNVLGNLVLNTPYNFFTTLSFPRVENVSYYQTNEEVKNIISPKYSQPTLTNKNANVVIIIMESFSREYMGIGNKKGYTPFLDSLAGKATFFDHHFANGRRSIDAVPSILASIPSLMEESYITGVYQGNELHGLAELLTKNGYTTSFFHGGRNGTMGFDKFSINSGVQTYYGLDEYPDKDKDFDEHWGVYDEPYLNYFCTTLSGFKKPFMAGLFTLSSHQPYSIPEKYKGIFPKGDLEIHESIGYADYALRKFFECASTKDWYNNTLFVITADHTQSLITPAYNNVLGEYRVPLILFRPGKKVNGDTSQISEHLDIMPTVLDYLGIKNERPILFSRSVLDSTEGHALFYTNNTYVYVKKKYFIEFDTKKVKMYNINDKERKFEIVNQPEIKAQLEKELKAYIQYYNNGLNANSWYRIAD
jgi:phosphoglycerol transferase MdoB-like AlkP superfamily enzyme